MDIHDYLIEQGGHDWAKLLADWVPPLPKEFTVWLVNRFGDVFAVYQDESVNWLRMDNGTLTRLADNREHFCELIDIGENADDWLIIPIVDDLMAAGVAIRPSQCYSYKILPLLGGKYELDNIVPSDLAVTYSFVADIYRQTKDLPNGTQVRLMIKS